ncbi:MAG TPA: hypothetical protein VH639_10650 [Bryobacteraceae bacterium]|jgi:hypothetical protein
MRTRPPVWAEATLRIFLKADAFASVAGDLLEQYRDSILPNCGLASADRWYLKQVAGFALRSVFAWAALFAGAFVARSALDWFRPTNDFQTRSHISTAIAAALLLAVGFRTAWQSRSFTAGAIAGFVTTAIAAALSIVGNAALFATWHDPGTMSAIQDSGGLGEAFELPVVLILPGIVLGGVGGLVGAGISRLARPT